MNNPTKGTHEYQDDPRNADIIIDINGEYFARDEAKVSVFDSGFVLGDGVWEGLRVHQGRIAFLDQHLERLLGGAKALDMEMEVTVEELGERLYRLLEKNNMREGVHIRLMVSRGVKATPYQDPRITITPPTIVIVPEYKQALPETAVKGIKLFTVHVRRGYPDVQDPKLNSHSKLNCIAACIQFVATCNSTHFFIVRKNEVWTSSGDYCLGGITRGNVIEICEQNQIPVRQKNFSLTDVYSANEAFVTGTFAGLAPVREIDGRIIGDGERGPMVEKLQQLYLAMLEQECA
jgi:branched-chain amino acid aminotransferase